MNTKRDLQWAAMLRELEDFQEAYGHTRADEEGKRYPALASWLLDLRGRLETLTYSQILGLDDLGFFARLDERWLDRYAELKRFKERTGHCRVPKPEDRNSPLASWVQFQRKRVNKMVPWRRKLLTDLGFDWAPLDTAWRAHYEELIEFKRKYGHTYVPSTWTENPELANWVIVQRHRTGKPTGEQIAMLEKAGFDWEPYESAWMRHYEELKAFRDKNGHSSPRVDTSELGKWVHKQRMKADRMAPHRKTLLNEIGFCWGEKTRDAWMRHYEELKAYHIKHGRSPGIKESLLGAWVSNQRTAYRTRRMPRERKKLLDEIGFIWAIGTPR